MLTIIQNDPEVPLGNYAEALTAFGVPYRVLPAFSGAPLPAIADCSALMVLGGAMSVHETDKFPFLSGVKNLIRDALAQGTPYLGLCLGGQLLADAAGAMVACNRWEELGTLPVHLNRAGESSPLFAGVPSPFPTFQWHHDSFDLPNGALLLASSPACPHQAFSLGRTAFGLQFHPEMIPPVIADWCRWSPETGAASARILADFFEAQEAYLAAGWQILRNFLRLAGMVPGNQA